MEINLAQLIIGAALGVLVALAAWKAHTLTPSGAVAAAVTGGLLFGLGGWKWALLLLAFFISSSGLSKTFKRQKQGLNEKFSKGSQRDWAQVFANGGVGALLVLVHTALPEADWPWLAYAGTLAAVNADTWATELGVLSRSQPRLVTNFRLVERGVSGAISLEGSLAALAGAGFIGLLGLVGVEPGLRLGAFVLVALAGFGAALLDSYLGATIQAIFHCPACDKETERHPLHTCGSATTLLRGWRWFDNDVVNVAAALAGALVAALGWLVF